MLEILKKLCEIPSAPGMEKELLKFIEESCPDNFVKSYDGMGNLIVCSKCGKENAKKILVAVSTDRNGFIANYIEENGFIRVTRLGGTSVYSAAYTKAVSDKGIYGFIVPEKGVQINDGDASKLYIDIGAKSREDAEKHVSLGDIFALIPDITELKDGKYGGSGAATRVPVAAILKVISQLKAESCDVYFSFNAQDSLGGRGSKVCAFDIQPDLCICIDICESLDAEGADKRGEAVLGDGAVILAKASDFCANQKVRTEFEEMAKQMGIKYKTCVYPEMTTTASVISKCREGCECIALCIPVRSIGSGAEIFRYSDVENLYKLILSVL